MSNSIPAYRVTLVKESSVQMATRPQLRSSADIYNLMKPLFDDMDREAFYIILLDTKNKVIGVNCVSIGSLTSSLVSPREVFKPVVAYNDNIKERTRAWCETQLTEDQKKALEKKVLEAVCRHSCSSIILCHQHPSGDPTPSPEDLHITNRLREIGDIMSIRVLDHVIVGDGQYVSFVDDGYWS
jgi:DNA repair protein RadC